MFGQVWKTQMLRVKLTPNDIEVVGAGREHGMILEAAPEIVAQEVSALEVAAIVPMIVELSSITGTEVQPDIVAREGRKKRKEKTEKDDSVDMLHWVCCDNCKKWRVVNRPYDDSEAFQCVHVALYDRDHANCEAPSAWIESDVPAPKKKKKKLKK